MRILDKNEIDNLLKEVSQLEEKDVKKKKSNNKTVKILKKISLDFDELLDLFDQYFVGLYGKELFENKRIDSGNLKGLTKRMFDFTADLSLNVGKLDDALSTDPPKTSDDIETANRSLRQIEINHSALRDSFNNLADEDKTDVILKISNIMEKAYNSLKVKIDDYNLKSPEKLQALKGE